MKQKTKLEKLTEQYEPYRRRIADREVFSAAETSAIIELQDRLSEELTLESKKATGATYLSIKILGVSIDRFALEVQKDAEEQRRRVVQQQNTAYLKTLTFQHQLVGPYKSTRYAVAASINTASIGDVQTILN